MSIIRRIGPIILILSLTLVCAPPQAAAKKKAGDASASLQAARKSLKDAKKALGDDYNCCVEPSCDFCALAMGKCPCAENLAAGKPICGNCADGWAAGRGQNKKIDPSTIKHLTPEQAKTLFEKRARADR